MQTCFELLGVSSSVTQKELKRAYFSQVRLHPPEKDPEAFKKIRVAYEEATQALEIDKPVFATSDNPNENELEKNLQFAFDRGDLDEAYALVRKGNQLYPNNKMFLYQKCRLMRIRNTNAIKIAEKLVKQDPENRHYQMELALCYMTQGWDKRALDLGKKILAKGVRNTEFITGYIDLLGKRNDDEQIYTILYKLISENECQNTAYLADLTNLGIELVCTAARLEDAERQTAARKALTDFVRGNQDLLGDKPITTICQKLRNRSSNMPKNQANYLGKVMQDLQGLSKDKKETKQLSNIVGEGKLREIMNDRRLPDCVEVLYRAYSMTPDFHPNAVKIDARLCGIAERDKLLACKDILKKEYPDFYSKIVSFLRAISTPQKTEKLKEELMDKYLDYDADYFPGRRRYFFELHPEEKPEWMDDDDDYYDDDDDDDFFDFDDDDDDFLERLLRQRLREIFGSF
ncbi:MAG: J domain-containing protein [Clostridia bacterium]|nr:J domain-containing protein [Clostridia bacterium]